MLVRGTNAFGPRQIERVVPTFAVNALRGLPLPVYDRGQQRREFLYVGDWVRGALAVLDRGEPGVVYNIGQGHELENIELARRICELAGASADLIEFVADRPGHDFRYGVALGPVAFARLGADVVVRRRPRTYRGVVPRQPRGTRRGARRARRDGAAESGRCGVRLVVTGAGGDLARAFLAQVPPHHEVHAFDRDRLDVGDHDAVRRWSSRSGPTPC